MLRPGKALPGNGHHGRDGRRRARGATFFPATAENGNRRQHRQADRHQPRDRLSLAFRTRGLTFCEQKIRVTRSGLKHLRGLVVFVGIGCGHLVRQSVGLRLFDRGDVGLGWNRHRRLRVGLDRNCRHCGLLMSARRTSRKSLLLIYGDTALQCCHSDGATPSSPTGHKAGKVLWISLRRPAGRGKETQAQSVRSVFFEEDFVIAQAKPRALREMSRFSQ